MSDLYTRINNIYNHIADKESKEIFINRFLFNISGNYNYLRELIRLTDLAKNVSSTLKQYAKKGKQIILDGARQGGKSLFEVFPEIEWACISDSSGSSSYDFRGVPIIKREEVVKKYPNAIFVILRSAFCGIWK